MTAPNMPWKPLPIPCEWNWRVLALGWQPLNPGAVATNLYASWRDRSQQGFDEIVPNPLQSEDVARCVKFILEQPSGVLVPRLFVVPATSPV